MGCAIFTLLGLYVTVAGKSNKWLIAATIIAAIGLFIVAAYGAWDHENLKLEKAECKLSELEEQLTDKGPQLTIERWGAHQNPVHPNDAIQHGFYMRNFGETAYSVKVESFTIATPYGMRQRISSVETSNIANDNEGFVPVFIENRSPVFRWQLEELLLESCSGQADAKPVIPIAVIYIDARGRHYRATWDLIYIPIRREIKFKFIKREKAFQASAS